MKETPRMRAGENFRQSSASFDRLKATLDEVKFTSEEVQMSSQSARPMPSPSMWYADCRPLVEARMGPTLLP